MTLRLLILALLIWLIWRWLRRSPTRRAPRTPAEPRLQTMVRCARCGLHVVESDALRSADRYYCSAQHQLEDDR